MTASSPSPLPLLVAFVNAHAVPLPNTGNREPILLLSYDGGAHLQHHGLLEVPSDADEALIDELHHQGLISIEYQSGGTKLITPTPQGRAAAAEYERAQSAEAVADPSPLLNAIAAQSASESQLAWPSVRPVLVALRDYWAAGGFSIHGIQLRPLATAVPEEHEGLFVATIRSLVQGDYLRADGSLSFGGIPSEVQLTDRARSILDGWPGADPRELVENLLAVLAEQARSELDPTKKKRLEAVGSTIKDLGVATVSETLAKVLTGGMQ
jgi:hypothetical protein